MEDMVAVTVSVLSGFSFSSAFESPFITSLVRGVFVLSSIIKIHYLNFIELAQQ